jgi:hypothetical protein
MPPKRTLSSAMLYFGIVLVLAGCGSQGPSTVHVDPPPAKAIAAQRVVAAQREAQARIAAETAHTDMLRALHACSEQELVPASNTAPLHACETAIERLEHDYEAHDLTEATARVDLRRIDWMHPANPGKGEGNRAFAIAQLDFKLVFSYTETPLFPPKPTCITWSEAGEYADVAFLARIGWPFPYLRQGEESVNETCRNAAVEGLDGRVLLGYLLCTSVLPNAVAAQRIGEHERRLIEYGIKCGENTPETQEGKEKAARTLKEQRAGERAEGQSQASEVEEGREGREQAGEG